MNDSERLAMAAHLHVALRRKVGRVTDTEWMASNPEYGLAMVDLALQHAEETLDQELGRLALRFGAALTLKSARTGMAPNTLPASESSTGAPPEPEQSVSWWDSHFGRNRSAKPAGEAAPTATPSEPVTGWPSSRPAVVDGGPAPFKRGRYVGGLR